MTLSVAPYRNQEYEAEGGIWGIMRLTVKQQH